MVPCNAKNVLEAVRARYALVAISLQSPKLIVPKEDESEGEGEGDGEGEAEIGTKRLRNAGTFAARLF